MDFPRCTSDSVGNTLVVGTHTIELYSANGALLCQHYSDDADALASFVVDRCPTPYIIAAGSVNARTTLRLLAGDSDYATLSAATGKSRVVALAAAFVAPVVAVALCADGSLIMIEASTSEALRFGGSLTADQLWGASSASWARGTSEATGGIAASAFSAHRGGAPIGVLALAWGATNQLALAVVRPASVEAINVWSFAAPVVCATVSTAQDDASVVFVAVFTADGQVTVRAVSGAAPQNFVESTSPTPRFDIANGVSAWSSSECGVVLASTDRMTLFPVATSFNAQGELYAVAAEAIVLPSPAFTLAWPHENTRAVAVLLSSGLQFMPVHATVSPPSASLSGVRVMAAPQSELAALRATFEGAIATLHNSLASPQAALAALAEQLDELDGVAAAFFHREKALIGRVDPTRSAVFRSMEKLAALRTRLRALQLIDSCSSTLPTTADAIEQMLETHAAHAASAKELAHGTLYLEHPCMRDAVAGFHTGGYWDVSQGSLCITAIAAALRTDAQTALLEPRAALHRYFDDAAAVWDPTAFATYVLYLASKAPRSARVAFVRSLNCADHLIDLAHVARSADEAPQDASDEAVTVAASALLNAPLHDESVAHLVSAALVAFADAGNVSCAAALIHAMLGATSIAHALPARAMMRVFFLCSVRAEVEPLRVLLRGVNGQDGHLLLLGAAAAVANARDDADVIRDLIGSSSDVQIVAALLKPLLRIQLLTVARRYVDALAEAEAYTPQQADPRASETHAALLAHLRALAIRVDGPPVLPFSPTTGTSNANAAGDADLVTTGEVVTSCLAACSSLLEADYDRTRSAAPRHEARAVTGPTVGLRSAGTTAAPVTRTATLASQGGAGQAKCQFLEFGLKQPCDTPRPCPYHD